MAGFLQLKGRDAGRHGRVGRRRGWGGGDAAEGETQHKRIRAKRILASRGREKQKLETILGQSNDFSHEDVFEMNNFKSAIILDTRQMHEQ